MCISQASNPNLPKSIPALITEALRACDPELRQVLMGNVVLTGGGSQFSGFADRLSTELTRSFPHVRLLGKCYTLCRYLAINNSPFSVFGFLRPRFMHLATLLSAGMAAGWVEVFWRAWVLSINFGSVGRSGRFVLSTPRL